MNASLLDLIAQPNLAADPFLQMGLGLLGSAYAPRAPLAGASAGLNAANRAQAIEVQNMLARIKMAQAGQEMADRQSLLSTITDPTMRVLAGIAPEQFVTGFMKNLGAGGAPPPSGLLTRKELSTEYDLSKYTPESVREMYARGSTAGGYDPGLLQPKPFEPELSDVMSVRKAAQKDLGNVRAAVEQGRKVKTALAKPGPIADVTALYSFITALDPQSVVRESEVGLMNSAMGLYNQLWGLLQSLQGKGPLTPATRREIGSMVDSLMGLYREEYDALRIDYTEFAEGFGVEPAKVLGRPIVFPGSAAATAPGPGPAPRPAPGATSTGPSIEDLRKKYLGP